MQLIIVRILATRYFREVADVAREVFDGGGWGDVSWSLDFRTPLTGIRLTIPGWDAYARAAYNAPPDPLVGRGGGTPPHHTPLHSTSSHPPTAVTLKYHPGRRETFGFQKISTILSTGLACADERRHAVAMATGDSMQLQSDDCSGARHVHRPCRKAARQTSTGSIEHHDVAR